MHVSNFRAVKRPADCVEILAKVKSERANVRLIMVGDGPERSAVTIVPNNSDVNDDMVFVGKQANIADYLGVADVFLLPSELESFGLAALEAQPAKCRLSRRASAVFRRSLPKAKPAFLSDVGDIEKMADDTLRLSMMRSAPCVRRKGPRACGQPLRHRQDHSRNTSLSTRKVLNEAGTRRRSRRDTSRLCR